jgi:DNA-directed RNA polymerase specialized sigma subunit
MNVPLVINRASIFWSRTPRSNLSFMDLVQIGVEGLIAAVDKYCGQYSEVYRSVIIGRIVGLYIRSYSSTMIHFYPQDKRKLYRANKFRAKHADGTYSLDELVDNVTTKDGETNESEIVNLLAAASMVVQRESSWGDDDSHRNDGIEGCPDSVSLQPDSLVEHNEAMNAMHSAIDTLSLLDKKLLLLKGIDISGMME